MHINDRIGKLITREYKIARNWSKHTRKTEEEEPEIIRKEELINAAKKIKSAKASGRNGITPEIIKYINAERIKQMIGHLNEISKKLKIPKEWNKRII